MPGAVEKTKEVWTMERKIFQVQQAAILLPQTKVLQLEFRHQQILNKNTSTSLYFFCICAII